MQRVSATILLAILVLTAAAVAQNPPMPKPAPEVKKLEYFVGTWSSEGDMKPSLYGPGGKYTGTDHIEWMDGGFFLVGHSEGNSPMGQDKGMSFWGYNPEEKVYTYHAFNNFGEAVSARGTVEGDSWTWTTHDKMGGKMVNGRFSMKILSPTSYTFKYEMQPEGEEWATVMEGKTTKK